MDPETTIETTKLKDMKFWKLLIGGPSGSHDILGHLCKHTKVFTFFIRDIHYYGAHAITVEGQWQPMGDIESKDPTNKLNMCTVHVCIRCHSIRHILVQCLDQKKKEHG